MRRSIALPARKQEAIQLAIQRRKNARDAIEADASKRADFSRLVHAPGSASFNVMLLAQPSCAVNVR
jgi:hypothetical protein